MYSEVNCVFSVFFFQLLCKRTCEPGLANDTTFAKITQQEKSSMADSILLLASQPGCPCSLLGIGQAKLTMGGIQFRV